MVLPMINYGFCNSLLFLARKAMPAWRYRDTDQGNNVADENKRHCPQGCGKNKRLARQNEFTSLFLLILLEEIETHEFVFNVFQIKKCDIKASLYYNSLLFLEVIEPRKLGFPIQVVAFFLLLAYFSRQQNR